MTLDVDYPPGCGNAPRAQIACDIAVAIFGHDYEEFGNWFNDATSWTVVSIGTINGIQEVPKLVHDVLPIPAEHLSITTVLTHGKYASISGVAELGSERVEFSDVYEFKGHSKTSQLQSITSYWIDN
jgi:hypothetical protein